MKNNLYKFFAIIFFSFVYSKVYSAEQFNFNVTEIEIFNKSRKKNENGMKRLEGTYLNGFKNGLWTRWYGNGVVATKYIYDNSAPNGKVTEWHIDKECWNKKGMECECGPSWWDDCEEHQ